MNCSRVLVACQMRSYREAIAAAFRVLRPDIEVFEAEEDLDREVGRLDPDLVVCSQLTARVEARASNWVELYPRCGSLSVVNIGGALEDRGYTALGSALDSGQHGADGRSVL